MKRLNFKAEEIDNRLTTVELLDALTKTIQAGMQQISTSVEALDVTANLAKSTADTATATAKTAEATAATANATARTARNTARTANETAKVAQATADVANATAEVATATAKTATATANVANSTAETAKSAAATAQHTADTAKAAADTAQFTANAASSAAATAKALSDEAKLVSEQSFAMSQAAEETANTALATAATAASTASVAAVAADVTKIQADVTNLTAEVASKAAEAANATAKVAEDVSKVGDRVAEVGQNVADIGTTVADQAQFMANLADELSELAHEVAGETYYLEAVKVKVEESYNIYPNFSYMEPTSGNWKWDSVNKVLLTTLDSTDYFLGLDSSLNVIKLYTTDNLVNNITPLVLWEIKTTENKDELGNTEITKSVEYVETPQTLTHYIFGVEIDESTVWFIDGSTDENNYFKLTNDLEKAADIKLFLKTENYYSIRAILIDSKFVDNLTRIENLVDKAQESADNAQKTANTAEDNAQQGIKDAKSADDHAAVAEQAAKDAWTYADTANKAADDAAKKAIEAYEFAEDAQKYASDAAGEAMDAKNFADKANQLAEETKGLVATAEGHANDALAQAGLAAEQAGLAAKEAANAATEAGLAAASAAKAEDQAALAADNAAKAEGKAKEAASAASTASTAAAAAQKAAEAAEATAGEAFKSAEKAEANAQTALDSAWETQKLAAEVEALANKNKDNVTDIYDNKLTAGHISGLGITASKIEVKKDGTPIFRASTLDSENPLIIGGFGVNEKGIFSGSIDSMRSAPSEDPKFKGVYLGTDGININGKFIVDIDGNLLANKLTLTDAEKERLRLTVTKTEYAKGDTGTAAPQSGWQTTPPEVNPGEYLWTRLTYNDGKYSYQVSRQSTDAVSYWLNISSPVHLGVNQKQAITVTAMTKVGETGAEENDTTAVIKYKFEGEGNWTDTKTYSKTFAISDFTDKESNLLLEVYHGETKFESETITFSPLNTPILDLDNDNATLAYNSFGTTKMKPSDKAISTAQVYYNGVKVQDLTYTWTLSGCKLADDTTSCIGNKLEVDKLDIAADTATATCTVQYPWPIEEDADNTLTLTKTFTITKVCQGTSPYKLDIYNDFVSIPADCDGNVSNYSWDQTKHIVTAYYGDEQIPFTCSSSNPATTASNDAYHIKYTTDKVTLSSEINITSNNNYKVEPVLKAISAKTGKIIYELYKGTTQVATAKFEASRLDAQVPTTSYWLDVPTPVHTGENHTSNIVITAKVRAYNDSIEGKTNTTSYIRWKYKNGGWNSTISTDGVLTIPATKTVESNIVSNIENKDIIIEASHNNDFTQVYETETITFSPFNTPVLDLDNDSATLAYTPGGNKIGDDVVASTATLYFNGKEVEADKYEWYLSKCKDKNDISTKVESPTIEIKTLTDYSATATCYVDYDGKKYSKVFTITRQIQGDKGDSNISYWINLESATITKSENGVLTPTNIPFSILKKDGTEATEIITASDANKLVLKVFKDNDTVDLMTTTDTSTKVTLSGTTYNIPTLNTSNKLTIELYQNNILIDKETVNIVKDGINGASATSYWVNVSQAVHTGNSQETPIKVTAMKQEGTKAEEADGSAKLFYRFKSNTSWSNYTTSGIANCRNEDLYILATHKNSFTPDGNTASTDSNIYDWETITYSPLNTPVLDLTNDNATITYSANGSTKTGNNVSSTAKLYLNGTEVESESLWILTNCTATNTILNADGVTKWSEIDNNSNPSKVINSSTITINNLSTNNAQATCWSFEKLYNPSLIVYRPNFTEENWATYGAINHIENWTNAPVVTKDDYFIIIGKSADLGTGHILWYKSDEDGSNAHGVCVAHKAFYEKEFSIAKQLQGLNGKDGSDGKDGTSITIKSIQYQAGTSGTTKPTSTWSNEPVAVGKGGYLWTKTTYSDNSEVFTSAYQGNDGTNGTSVGVSKIEYTVTSSNSTPTSGWSQTYPTTIGTGKYLWTKTTYTDGKAVYTSSYQGTNGQDGTNGTNGTSAGNIYALNNSNTKWPGYGTNGTKPTINSSGWTKAPQEPTATNKYCWVCAYTVDANGAYTYETPIIHASYEGMIGLLTDKGLNIVEKDSETGEYYVKTDHISGTLSNKVTVGGFNIDDSKIWAIDKSTNCGNREDNGRPIYQGAGMTAKPNAGGWAIWAGPQSGNGSTECTDESVAAGNYPYGQDAPFKVSHDGTVYAEKLVLGATGETINNELNDLVANHAKIMSLESNNVVVTETGNKDNIIFKADGRELDSSGENGPTSDEDRVKIGGFTVSNNKLAAGYGTSAINLQTEHSLSEYIPAQYIITSGLQYINTGLIIDYNTDAVEITVAASTSDQNGMFFGQWSANNKHGVLYHYKDGNAINAYITNNEGTQQTFTSGLKSTDLNQHTYKIVEKKLYVDGNLKADFSAETLDGGSNVSYIGAAYQESKRDANWFYHGKIYGCKIWQKGILVRNYVPAYKNCAFGLFDTCYRVFYPSKTMHPFNGVTNDHVNSIITKNGVNYKRLDYIQNDGTNYIDTGIILNSEGGFDIKAVYTPTAETSEASRCCILSNYNNDLTSKDLAIEIVNNQSRVWHYNNEWPHYGEGMPIINQYLGSISTTTKHTTRVTSIMGGWTHSVDNITASCFNGEVPPGSMAPSLYIFVDRMKRFNVFNVPLKLYSLEIYSNGSLVADFVPAKEETTDKVGLLNLMDGSFHATAEGNNFTYGDYQFKNGTSFQGAGDDSATYRSLMYIESYNINPDTGALNSNKQYIDTGVPVGLVTAIEVDFETFTLTSAYGAIPGYNYTCSDTYPGGYFYYGLNNGALGWTTQRQRQTIKQLRNNCYRNGLLVGTFDEVKTFDNTQNIYLFGRNYTGTLEDYGNTRIYSCKIWSEYEGVNNLIRNFIPVIKNETEYGLYDLVESKFYGLPSTSKGSLIGGEFPVEFHAIYLGSDNELAAPFKVTNTGKLIATAGSIGGLSITNTALVGNSTYSITENNNDEDNTNIITSTVNNTISLNPKHIELTSTKQDSSELSTLSISPISGIKITKSDLSLENNQDLTTFSLRPDGYIVAKGQIGNLIIDDSTISATNDQSSLDIKAHAVSFSSGLSIESFLDADYAPTGTQIYNMTKPLAIGYDMKSIPTINSSNNLPGAGFLFTEKSGTTNTFYAKLEAKKQSDRDKFDVTVTLVTTASGSATYTCKKPFTCTLYCRWENRYTWQPDYYVTSKYTVKIAAGSYSWSRTFDRSEFASGKSAVAFSLTKDYGGANWGTYSDCLWIDGGDNEQQGYVKSNSSKKAVWYQKTEQISPTYITKTIGNILPAIMPQKNGYLYAGADADRGYDLGSLDYPFRHIYCTNLHVANGVSNYSFSFSDVTCFDAGTQVSLADGSTKNIEDVVEGDIVKSYNTKTDTVEYNKVLKTMNHQMSDELVKLTFDDNTEIFTTMTHPFYTTGGWVSLKPWTKYNNYEDLKDALFELMHVGQQFYKLNTNNEIELVTLTKIQYRHGIAEDHLVYNLDVDGANTFFVNNMLVHNK